jgi:putative transposase
MSDNMKSTLIIDALTMALYRRKKPAEVVVHSDRGSQYCSCHYQNLLKDNRLICSMSSTGNYYDNAAMESFFHTLKVELIHDKKT